eukprot:gene6661-8240_t
MYEFLPSISSTIGDFSPEMNVYRYGMALTSGLRLGTIFLNHYLGMEDKNNLMNMLSHQSSYNSNEVLYSAKKLSTLVPLSTVFDTIRVFSAGGWIYISSSEHLFSHQVGFVSYVIFSFLFMYTHSAVLYHSKIKFKYTTHGSGSNRGLLSLILPNYSSLKYFVDHTFYCVYLSYSKYSIFEWLLAFTNVAYDTLTYFDFEGLYFTLHKEKK